MATKLKRGRPRKQFFSELYDGDDDFDGEEKKREKTKICCGRKREKTKIDDGDEVRSILTPVLKFRSPVLTPVPETILATQLNAFVPSAFPKRE